MCRVRKFHGDFELEYKNQEKEQIWLLVSAVHGMMKGKLIAIWRRSVDATHDFLSKEYRAELEDLVSAFLPEAPLWVAVTEKDEPVAFMLLTGEHMDALFVDPTVRGCGVGKLLIDMRCR
jgi:GNAT superfamily N-acetyltransferase